MDILREVSDQHLTCSICMDLYTDPKQLPCLHSFCRKCLCTHIMKTVGGSGGCFFCCPVCRKECRPADPNPNKVLEWVDSYPDNFNIKSLLDTMEAQQKEVGPVPVQEQLRTMTMEAEMCPKHRKETVVSYCGVKKLGVCGICLKSSAHDKCAHKHLSPEQARRFAGERLHTFKRSIESLSDRVEATEDKLASRPNELKFKKEELTIEISQYFAELRTLINKTLLTKEKEALAELKTVIKHENSKIAGTKDKIKSLSGSLKCTEQLLDKLMENRPVGALSVAESVEGQIAAYERSTSSVEFECRELDITIRRRGDIRALMETLPWGRVQVGDDPIETELTQVTDPLTTQNTGPSHQAISNSAGYTATDQTNLKLSAAAGSLCATGEGATCSAKTSSAPDRVLIQRATHETLLSQPPPSTSPGSFISDNVSSIEGSQVPQGASASVSVLKSPVRTITQLPGSFSFSASDLSHTGQPRSMPVSDLPFATGSTSPSLPHPDVQNPQTHSDRGFSVTLINEFNGLCPEDIRNASYVGACPYGQNCLIILDRWNKKLKVVQVGGRILFFLRFEDPMEPWDVTPISDDLVAVTCPSQCYFLVIEILLSSMKIGRNIKTQSGYSSLVHLDTNRFAAGVCKPFGSPRVDILDTSSSPATVLMQLDATVTYPRTLDLTLDRNMFICDWSHKELTIFDPADFRQVRRYKGVGKEAVLREPVAVAKDKKGHLYIMDRKTKKVHALSCASGTLLAILPLEIPSDPKVIVVAEAESRYSASGEVLVVATGNGKLYVYDLVTP